MTIMQLAWGFLLRDTVLANAPNLEGVLQMATKTARKATASKAAKKSPTSKAKTASSAKMGTAKSKSKVFSGKGVKAASSTRATSKAKKAIAPKKSVSSRSSSVSKSKSNKMTEAMDDTRLASADKNNSLTSQSKMKLSRRKPDNFRDDQRVQSSPDSVNPATRR
jgi:hypothetical protein